MDVGTNTAVAVGTAEGVSEDKGLGVGLGDS